MECTNKASAKDQVSKKKEKKKKKDDGEETSIFDLLSPPSVSIWVECGDSGTRMSDGWQISDNRA